MRFIPLTSSVLGCGWQMAPTEFLLSPWVGRFNLFTLWLGRRSANHLLWSVLGWGKIGLTRWLQTACLTICLSLPIPLLCLFWPTSLFQCYVCCFRQDFSPLWTCLSFRRKLSEIISLFSFRLKIFLWKGCFKPSLKPTTIISWKASKVSKINPDILGYTKLLVKDSLLNRKKFIIKLRNQYSNHMNITKFTKQK